MPRLNGIEAVKQIRSDASLKDMKVIAVTASVFPEFRKKAIESGTVIDLMKELSDSSGNPLEIKDVLEPGAYGIDTREFFL